MDVWLIRIGAVGASLAALCCFTPALTVVLGIVGLAAWREPLDLVALPMLALFATILIAGVTLRRRRARSP
jgi:mercuric ion transport protein